MPGIAGIISKAQPEACANEAKLMIECMKHEPFYNSCTYVNEQLGVYVGAVCHKGSFADCMPVFNEERDLVLIFSGENLADTDLTNRLKGQGHLFDSSKASYLIHLYEEEGDDFLQRLNGFFCGIIVDLRTQKMIIFNDRYGMQRIYYHEGDNEFLFSSEAKSLLKVRPGLRKLDPKSLGEFFSCGSVLENKSLFSKIYLLPGGSSWAFHGGDLTRKDSYFQPSAWENQPILEKEIFYSRLRETFSKILPRYFRSKNPIGMSVTGGLDSRMILACSSESFPCYTFGGIYRDCFDVRIGQKVAAECHQTHEVIRLDKGFFNDFQKYAEKTVYLTDGCHDVGGSHDIFLNKRAREIAPIRITGKFGGEVLRGVAALKADPPSKELFDRDYYQYILKASDTVSEVGKDRALTYSVFRCIPWGMYGSVAAEQSQVTYRAPFMDNDFVGLLYQAPAELLCSKEISLRLIGDNNSSLAGILTDRGFGGRHVFPLSSVIKLFYWGLFKLDWYYGVGMPDWAIKLESKSRLLHLRNLFLGTQRIDHYRMWFQNEISDYIREILLDRVTIQRPYFNKHYLEHVVESHMQGRRNYTNEINKALTVELIQRFLIENI